MRTLLFVLTFLLSVSVSATDYTAGNPDTSGGGTAHNTISGGWARGALFNVPTGGTLDSILATFDDACTSCSARAAVYLDSDSSFVDSTYKVAFNFTGGNGTLMLYFVGGSVSSSTDYFVLFQGPTATGDVLAIRTSETSTAYPVRRHAGQSDGDWIDPTGTLTRFANLRYSFRIYWHDVAAGAGQVITTQRK